MPNFPGKVLKFPLRPDPPISKVERIDTSRMTTENLGYLCGGVMDASLREDPGGKTAATVIAWFLTNSNRKQLEEFMDWIQGGMPA